MSARKKIVVLWGHEDVMSIYLSNFLTHKEKWEVITVSCKTELEKILREESQKNFEITLILPGCQDQQLDASLDLLQNYPVFKMILVSLQNNSVEIFRKEEKAIDRTVDLVSAIENEL
jgi:hypothetical protein